jgi:hypothetical protein
MEVIAGLMEPREATLAWVVAPTFELTRRVMDRVRITLRERLAHRIQSIVPREQLIRVVNFAGGISEVRGKSADRPDGLLGEALDFLVVDEATQLREDVWTNSLSARLIDRGGWSLIVSTPAGPGWFYQEFRRGQRNRDPDCESWSMPTWTNPHIDRAVVEAERGRLPPDTFEQQYLAKFLGVENEPCLECGGPREEVSGVIDLPEKLDETSVPTCSTCGMFVDEKGFCLVKKCNEWYAEIEIFMGDRAKSAWYTCHLPDKQLDRFW